MITFDLYSQESLNPSLKLISLHDEFIEEYTKKLDYFEKGINLRSGYLSEEACSYQIYIKDSLFYDSLMMPLEDGSYLITMTGSLSTEKPSLNNIKIYASRKPDDEQKLSSLPSTLTRVINHPNFVRGNTVAFSGHITIVDCLLESVDNNSGHYKPKLEQVLLALAYLGK